MAAPKCRLINSGIINDPRISANVKENCIVPFNPVKKSEIPAAFTEAKIKSAVGLPVKFLIRKLQYFCMNNFWITCLLFIALMASGCTTEEAGKRGIVVNDLSVEPSNIKAGSGTSVNLEVENAGLLEGSVNIGEENGSRIMTNYCSDVFDIREFRASSSRLAENNETYVLGPDERLEMFWNLNQSDAGDIPLPGYDCNMRFQIPFDYSVSSFKQVQLKQSADVSKDAELNDGSTSGPLGIDMELVGGSQESNTIVKDRSSATSLYVTAYNRGDNEDNEYRGLINMGDIDVGLRGFGPEENRYIELEPGCGEKSTVRLASGNKEIYQCEITNVTDFDENSVRGEIYANVNYTYVRDIGSRQVQVEYSNE